MEKYSDYMEKLSNWFPLITALLAFVGALLGTYMAGSLSEKLWERQARHAHLQKVMEQRVELIERISRIGNLGPKMESLQSFAELQAQLAVLYAECKETMDEAKSDTDCHPPYDAIDVVRLSNERAELNAEFSSAMQLVALYFGPDSRKAVEEYSRVGAWWKADPQYLKALLSSMQDELTHGVE